MLDVGPSIFARDTPVQPDLPFFREQGDGPGVVCLHSNGSSSRQWLALTEALAPRFHVLAPDSYGAGKSPPWPTNRQVGLRDELELLEPVFARAGEPFTLVGHSYGGAIALVAAVTQPRRIRAMALYEPVLFSVLDAESPPPNDADGIRDAVGRAAAALDAGDPDRAAECFTDFWMGTGTWKRMPESRKEPIAAAIVSVREWLVALLGEPTRLESFAALDVPVLYMIGKRSPAPSRGVAKLLTRVLPRVEVVEFEGLGHMGPVTHPGVVNEAIAKFLRAG